MRVSSARRTIKGAAAGMLLGLVTSIGCLSRPTANPNVLVVGITSDPNSLDPRFGLDDVSQKIWQLLFDSLLTFDDELRVVGGLAQSFENPTPLTYVARLHEGVRFHDGHELTSADVVYTFQSVLDPTLASSRRGGFREILSIEPLDRYTVRFTLRAPYTSFPINLISLPIIPDHAGIELRERPVGTGPYRFVRHLVDDQVELAAFPEYWQGAPRNEGLVLKVVPDEVMRALEVQKGTLDIVVNDVSPDIFFQLGRDPQVQMATGPGVDYQYIGLNLRDPLLHDVRVRRALAYAIDRQAIVDYLRRGLAAPAVGLLPPLSWAFDPGVRAYQYDPPRAKALLDEAGYPDPDGDGPMARLRLSLKVSNVEFNRLQSSVIQEELRRVGIALDVRTYEFATLFADVQRGNFQLFTLQWPGGAVADPDILRRVFHSSQVPPAGFNRGHYSNVPLDALLDRATASRDDSERRELYGEAQRILAEDVPYISLWYKTNLIIARRNLSGLRLTPLADFTFLREVGRTETRASNQ
jgi:peptide/nickel transport system substrate-binding protein